MQPPAKTTPYRKSHKKPGHATLCSCVPQPSYQWPLTLLFPSASAVLNWWQQTQAEAMFWCSEVQHLEENVILLLKSTPLVQRELVLKMYIMPFSESAFPDPSSPCSTN